MKMQELKNKVKNQPDFLPANRQEMDALGWEELDILLLQGDAYIDHPAQGPALLGRWLVAHGFKVGIISQPDWRDVESFKIMGRPRLFAAISAGSMDSMLAHYTAFRKKRSDDAMTPGGRAGARPNRASLVYTGLMRAAFPALKVAVGGIEASLRRLSHYDFWEDRLRPSILLESKADILVYGPGERPLLDIACRLNAGEESLAGIGGTALPVSMAEDSRLRGDSLQLPSHEEILQNPALLLKSALVSEKLIHQGTKAPMAFQSWAKRGVLVMPPASELSSEELDFIYSLPYKRRAHPSYKEAVPALNVLSTSISTHRGCGGGCSFCSLALHQGRHVISRSAHSIKEEARKIAKNKAVALSDVGGPTANMWGASCKLVESDKCGRVSCLWPHICPNFKADQKKWLDLLNSVAAIDGIKQLRVASGLRYDLALKDETSLRIFLKRYVGGQLKVAPEHMDETILRLMRKPGLRSFEKFLSIFESVRAQGFNQYVIPYLISCFPGCEEEHMKKLGDWFRERNWQPQQVQAFIPTPGTVATAMFYGTINADGVKIAVCRSDRERIRQHSFISRPSGGRKNAVTSKRCKFRRN